MRGVQLFLRSRRQARTALGRRRACKDQPRSGTSQILTRKLHVDGKARVEEYDVVVVGGGMVGAAVACALGASPMTRQLQVAVVDGQQVDPHSPLSPSSAPPDIRVSAITPSSVRLFKEVGAWPAVERSRMGPFDSMQVWDSAGQGFVRYSSADVGQPVLGYVVENKVLLAALHARLQGMDSVSLICPAKVQSVKWGQPAKVAKTSSSADGTVAAHFGDELAEVELSNGCRLRTRLVVGADGGRSQVRATAGLRTIGWQYKQRGLVATVVTETPHCTAWQRFLPTGPLALLPVGGTYSNIVWSTTEQQARELERMSPAEFVSAVNQALQSGHAPAPRSPLSAWLPQLRGFSDSSAAEGFVSPPTVEEAVGPRASFPLSLAYTGKYVGARLALVGDAAHTVHPLAGQGVNLGFGDAQALAAALRRGVETGRDVGEVLLLEEYEKERSMANAQMMAALDGLHRLFSTQWGPLAAVRNAGLDVVHWMQPLKNRIMSYAMGMER